MDRKALKRTFEAHIHFILSVGVFCLVRLFSQIFGAWWAEGEHWVIAAAYLQTVLLFGLATVEYASAEMGTDVATSSGMANSALFAMAMFIAERAKETLDMAFTEFQLLCITVLIVAVHGVSLWAFEGWVPADVPHARVLKATMKKLVLTWVTIAVAFVVAQLVGMFASWWRNEKDALVGVVLIEVIGLLIITVVKVSVYYERIRGMRPRPKAG
jgi:ABC-type multidrug transport system fused ATPase/permease subunit